MYLLTLALVTFSLQAAPPPPPVVVRPGAPGEPTTIVSGSAVRSLNKHTAADTNFMQGMIHHHAQAVEMVALLKKNTKRKDMQMLGLKIEVSQNDEMKMMRTWLKDRGEEVPMDHGGGHMMLMSGGTADGMMRPMPGMLSDKEMKALAAARGAAFDKLFLEGMIKHHVGALTMVEELFDSPGAGQESMIFDFASHVDADQRMDISRMRAMLKKK